MKPPGGRPLRSNPTGKESASADHPDPAHGASVPPSRAPRARALRKLRHQIESGQIRSGDVLPPERVLCTALEISRGTLRRVLEALESEGLVRPINGGKTRIASDHTLKDHTLKPHGDTIAVIAASPRATNTNHRQSGWVEFIALGALREVQRAGMNAISLGGGQLTEKDLDWILRWRPYGVVVPELLSSEHLPEEILRRLAEAKIPTVIYSGAEELAAFDRVSSDHEMGAYELTQWFLARGRKTILMTWNQPPEASYWHAARLRGYERAMREAGLKPLPVVEFLPYEFGAESDKSVEARAYYFAGYLARYFHSAQPVDAILAETDGILPALGLACRILGLEPNRDVWFAGYDNYWQDAAEQMWNPVPPLITVDKQNWDIGARLVRLLIDRIEGKLPPEPQWHLVPPKLMERASPFKVAPVARLDD